jgi:hypothetical protein
LERGGRRRRRRRRTGYENEKTPHRGCGGKKKTWRAY